VQITLDSIKRADEYNGADSLAEMADRYRYLLNASLFAYKLYLALYDLQWIMRQFDHE